MDPENLPKFVYLHKNHKYRLKLGFYAAPSNPKTFSKAVRDELNNLKFTYCPDLNGLVMGFGKISSNELIPADIRHCISVAVNVDVYIFRPPVGSLIEAVVNQTSDNHVSCLVHNLFNVSIVRPEHQPYTQWPGSKIKIDDNINVKVLSFDLTKKLPHITGEIVDKKDDNCNDQLKINCTKYSSSSEECTHNLNKSIKQSINNSESSDEMDFIRETHSAKCFDKPAKISSQVTQTNVNNNNILTNSPLGSSTPVTNSKNSVGSINLIRTKQLKQFHKHLAKNVADKQKSADFEKPYESVESDNCSSSLDIYESSNHNVNNNCKLPGFSMNNTDCLEDANNLNSYGTVQSSSGISNNDFVQLKSLSQNSLLSKSNTSLSSTIKHKSPNKIKSESSPLNQNIVFLGTNTDYSSTKYEDNSIFTQNNLDNKKFTNNVDKTVSSDIDALNKSKNPNTSKLNLLRLSTSTISMKQKNFSSNVNFKSCKNKNDSVKLQSDAMFTMLSDLGSCSNEHDEFSIPHTNQNVDFNKEIESNTICNLSAEKKSISIDHCTSSSDDEVYTKLKLNVSKLESTKPSIEKTEGQNPYIVYSSDNDSNNSDCNTSTVSSLEVIKSNTSPNKCANILVSNNCNLNNDNNVLPNKESKKKNAKSIQHESSEYNNNKRKLLPNFSNNANNSSNQMKQILEGSSSSDDELMNQEESNMIPSLSISKSEGIIQPIIKNEFPNQYSNIKSTNSTTSSSKNEPFMTDLTLNHSLKKNSSSLVTKGKLKKYSKLESAMKDNNPADISKSIKPLKHLNKKSKLKLSEETKNVFVDNFNEKILKKTKSQISSLVETNELFNLSTKNAKPKKSKDSTKKNVLNSIDHSHSFSQNNNLTQSNIISDASRKKNKKKSNKTKKPNLQLLVNSILKNLSDELYDTTEYSSQLNNSNKITVKKNEKTEPKKLSMITDMIDRPCNNKKKKKKVSKETKDSLLDNSISSIKSNYPTELSKLTKTSGVKTETADITNKLVCDTIKKKKKTKDLCLNNIVKCLVDSSTMKLKKRSRELEDEIIDFKSESSKKKKVDHYLKIDNINNELHNKSTVRNSLKVCKKKKNKKELQCDTNDYLTIKDNKTKYYPLTESIPKETNIFTDKKKEEKKIKKGTILPSDYTQHDIQSTSKEKIIKTNAELASTKIEKLDQSTKDKKLFSRNELEEFTNRSTMKHKKRSRELEDGIIDFKSEPSKKKKVDHYLKTDNINNELQNKSMVGYSPKVSKKKKNRTELLCDTINYSTIKDYKTKYDPRIESIPKETNIFIDKKKEEKKIKKGTILPSDHTQYDVQSTSREKIIKTNAKLASTKIKKLDQLTKKKLVSRNELEEFLSNQNNSVINDLDTLYNSFRF